MAHASLSQNAHKAGYMDTQSATDDAKYSLEANYT